MVGGNKYPQCKNCGQENEQPVFIKKYNGWCGACLDKTLNPPKECSHCFQPLKGKYTEITFTGSVTVGTGGRNQQSNIRVPLHQNCVADFRKQNDAWKEQQDDPLNRKCEKCNGSLFKKRTSKKAEEYLKKQYPNAEVLWGSSKYYGVKNRELCKNCFQKEETDYRNTDEQITAKTYTKFKNGNNDGGGLVKYCENHKKWDGCYRDKPNDIPKPKPRDKDKPNRKPDKDPNLKPDEVCERCGASCIIHKTKTSYTIKRKRYIKHKVNFTRESSQWFGLNCGCIEKYKQENQGTCPQCHKTEFPDMAKGWLLDYEVKMAFSSPLCHVTYRELKWEEAQRLTQIEMMPPELDVETNPGQNTDWEKEGLKREVLFWREYAKSLEERLNNQNLTPQERQQSNYLRNLQQNTLRNAESNYRNRYGELTEDDPNKGKGMSGGIIFLMIIGALVVVGGIIFLLTRNNKSKK